MSERKKMFPHDPDLQEEYELMNTKGVEDGMSDDVWSEKDVKCAFCDNRADEYIGGLPCCPNHYAHTPATLCDCTDRCKGNDIRHRCREEVGEPMGDTVWIDPRTKEPCRRCDGTGKMPPWPGSKGLVACGVCRETKIAAVPAPVESPAAVPVEERTARHELKTWPEYFRAIIEGRKFYEIRKNDRDYGVGDLLKLREWDNKAEAYTGYSTTVEVAYMTSGGSWGLPDDICVMSIVKPGQVGSIARQFPIPEERTAEMEQVMRPKVKSWPRLGHFFAYYDVVEVDTYLDHIEGNPK